MTNPQIKTWATKAKSPVGYNPTAKDAFLRGARSLANEIVKRLGLAKGEYRVSRNEGGIAVSGEVYVYTPHVFICIEQSCVGDGGFYYRTCEGLGKSGTGPEHVNNWIMWDRLIADPDYVIDTIKRLYDRKKAVEAAAA